MEITGEKSFFCGFKYEIGKHIYHIEYEEKWQWRSDFFFTFFCLISLYIPNAIEPLKNLSMPQPGSNMNSINRCTFFFEEFRVFIAEEVNWMPYYIYPHVVHMCFIVRNCNYVRIVYWKRIIDCWGHKNIASHEQMNSIYSTSFCWNKTGTLNVVAGKTWNYLMQTKRSRILNDLYVCVVFV